MDFYYCRMPNGDLYIVANIYVISSLIDNCVIGNHKTSLNFYNGVNVRHNQILYCNCLDTYKVKITRSVCLVQAIDV